MPFTRPSKGKAYSALAHPGTDTFLKAANWRGSMPDLCTAALRCLRTCLTFRPWYLAISNFRIGACSTTPNSGATITYSTRDGEMGWRTSSPALTNYVVTLGSLRLDFQRMTASKKSERWKFGCSRDATPET